MRKEAFHNKFFRKQRRQLGLQVVAGVDMSSLFQKASNMSDEERASFIKNFVSNFGIRDTIGLVKNVAQAFISSASAPQDTDQVDEYTPLAVSHRVNQIRIAQLYEGFKNRDDATPSAVKNTLDKLGDWGVLLTFILMLGVAGVSDFNSLVANDSSFADEIRAFLIASGSAFITWVLKFLSKKVK